MEEINKNKEREEERKEEKTEMEVQKEIKLTKKAGAIQSLIIILFFL